MANRLLLLSLILLLAGCRAEIQTSSPARPAAATSEGTTTATMSTDEGWGAMQSRLVGKWKATTPENRVIETSYRLVSKGSALVETFTSSSGKETITVYHRDGLRLMLTHYCAQGNQARLKATEATRDKVVFTFLDATNVSAGQGVMHKLAFVFQPDGTFDQETVYLGADGSEDATSLRFIRE